MTKPLTTAAAVRLQQTSFVQAAKNIVSEYTGIPVNQIGNYTPLGDGFEDIIERVATRALRMPVPDRPPSAATTFAELIGMFPLRPE